MIEIVLRPVRAKTRRRLRLRLVALVDDCDGHLASLPWRPQRSTTGMFYAVRSGPKATTIYLHRQVMDATQNIEVDHRNGNTLDCRRDNLRLATHAQNSRNVRIPRHNTTKYKGVRRSRGGRWNAYIKYAQVQRHLGSFDTKEEAAHAYDRAARKLFGEFARPNFPDQPDAEPMRWRGVQ